MPNRPAYILKIDGLATADDRDESQAQRSEQKRPWIAVSWKCCSVYSRIYRNRQGDAYEGRCPKCTKRVTASIGSGGTSNRFFEAE